ncbi:1-deoxy-D-xylulose-5-phosphate synthase [Chrysiogenes arsenatis]|uniref:1-deoxy-D-xylulose-5-phosphate synthase n=1 Tax=Chrysiogenes arsenatis TaxID=309797 RepID=UPI00040C068E|nr:1-deoxy-D-xylulose-5-phosphate synthase [Chrysiogenes arsenatis]
MKILAEINGPEDIQRLNSAELKQLATEVRNYIVDVTSQVGGHVASNLGVVDLTLALHKVFTSPQDKIIWDVGHQCYPHKIVTGRRDAFPTIRQFGGLSGFPKRHESVHDHLDSGHSSTSISAALGMSVANHLQGIPGKVIAVIGDGSMSAGMAFEGLNNAGHLDRDLIVILNDNEMSISENVGALSSYFSKIISGKTYNRMRRDIEIILGNLPRGERLIKAARKVEEGIKGFLTPGILFEELNFKYYGPVDGHDIDTMVEFLNNLKTLDGPILLHLITRKGKGYAPAENNPSAFHGCGPYNRETGEIMKSSGTPSYTAVAGDTLTEMAQHDGRIAAITAAMPDGTGLNPFREAHPSRFFDVGIAEQHAVTFAAGLALSGIRPYVFLYSTFLQRAYDQLLHDVCIQNLPVVFCIDRAGIVGNDGETHNGTFDISFLRSVPNLTLWSPRDEEELRQMMLASVEWNGPLAIRYPRGNGVGAKERPMVSDFSKWEIVVEGYQSVAVIATGHMVPIAEAVCDKLGVTLISARCVKPLDVTTLENLCGAHAHLVSMEENVLAGGFGSSLAEYITTRSEVGPRLHIMALPDRFIEHGDQPTLRARLGLDGASLTTLLQRILHES